jgi:hypothetical protein
MRGPFHEHRFSSRAVSALSKVRARTWLILGAAVVGILGLVTWVGIALLSWLRGSSNSTEAGRRLACDAVIRMTRSM